MKQLFLLICISIFVHSDYLELNKSDIEKIQKHPFKKAILLRFKEYSILKEKIQNFDTTKKLNHINTFFNRILPIHDRRKYKSDDYWSTPKEFMIDGRGDCEEYAISKYFSLQKLGIKKEKLFLSIVKVKGKTSFHMVLLYFKNKGSTPLVLDNLSFRVLPFDKRTDLMPKVIFNENSSYILKNKKIYKRVKIDWGKENKWAKLLKKIYKNK